jgi:hypothetical protein
MTKFQSITAILAILWMGPAFTGEPITIQRDYKPPGRMLSVAREKIDTPEKIQAASDVTLCTLFQLYRPAELRAELERRAVFTPAEWQLIDEQRAHVGMRRLTLICSWGYPLGSGRVNRTITAHGGSEQFVYRNWRKRDRAEAFIYVANGAVTAIQAPGQ